MDVIHKEKEMLREQMLLKRKQLPPDKAAFSNKRIFERIQALLEYKQAERIFCFVSMPHEVDTHQILLNALAAGKQVATPLCLEDGIMEARCIRSFEDLNLGAYGIMEPRQSCPVILKSEIQFAIVPCVTCDKNGNRLGWGKGYYDRFLENRRYSAAVVCREALMVSEIPTEPLDSLVDLVVTEEAVYRCNSI